MRDFSGCSFVAYLPGLHRGLSLQTPALGSTKDPLHMHLERVKLFWHSALVQPVFDVDDLIASNSTFQIFSFPFHTFSVFLLPHFFSAMLG